MKNILTAMVLLLPALCFAGPNTPALSQYLGQLQCSTKLAFEKADSTGATDQYFTQAAEQCVPTSFKPELGGLAENIKPASRQERIAALTRSLKTRAALCQKQKLSPAECVAMFAASES